MKTQEKKLFFSLDSPARRLSFIALISLVAVVVSYAGMLIVQTSSTQAGVVAAIFLTWCFIIAAIFLIALGITVMLAVLAHTWHLVEAIFTWVRTGKWLTYDEWENKP